MCNLRVNNQIALKIILGIDMSASSTCRLALKGWKHCQCLVRTVRKINIEKSIECQKSEKSKKGRH